MAQPLIYGAVGPEGGDYLLEFTYTFSTYALSTPFSVLGGTASQALSEGLLSVGTHVTSAYRIGRATYSWGQEGREGPEGPEGIPFFSGGVEIELRYAGRTSGVYDVQLAVRPNHDFYRLIYDGQHSAAPGGELVVRIVCKPESLQVYAGGQLVHESDPRTIDWDWVGPQPYYWMHLEVSAPFDRYSTPDGLVRVEGIQHFFQASRVPHIRAISYSLPRSLAPAFFRDFVRAYEIPGEGSGAVSPPPPPPPPPDDTGDDTVLVLSAPPLETDPLIVVESLPFRAIFDYSLGDSSVPIPLFTVVLAAGVYKFSTALSPHQEDYDTNIALFSYDDGTLLYTNDDLQSGGNDRRSEITATLAAGMYVLAVGTYGTKFGEDRPIDNSAATPIPPGAVLRISKV